MLRTMHVAAACVKKNSAMHTVGARLQRQSSSHSHMPCANVSVCKSPPPQKKSSGLLLP